jgi:hypothetical protein
MNLMLRAAIDGSAAAIQALATSFHPRRGDAGLHRDLARAQAMLDRQSNHITH